MPEQQWIVEQYTDVLTKKDIRIQRLNPRHDMENQLLIKEKHCFKNTDWNYEEIDLIVSV